MEEWKKGSLLEDFNWVNLKQGNEAQRDIPEGKTEFWIENLFFTWVIWTFAQPTLFLIARIKQTFSIVKIQPFFTNSHTVEECNISLCFITRVNWCQREWQWVVRCYRMVTEDFCLVERHNAFCQKLSVTDETAAPLFRAGHRVDA